jgi:hypothetical protein
MLRDRQQLLGLHERELPLTRLPGGPFDPLIHGVHYRPGEVRLGVGQLRLIVRTGSLGQGEESLGLKVGEQHATLPTGAGLNKKLGQH